MDDHNNNYNYTDINIGFGVMSHDPYDVPFSPSYFNVTNPTLDDLSINNNNNYNNNNYNNNGGISISSYSPLPQQQDFNNGISTSYSALPPLPQQQDFTNGVSASYSAFPPPPQQQDFINNGGVSASYSALPPLPQQQDFTNDGVQLQQGQSSTSYPFSYPMNPLMQDQFSQSNFSIGGQQQQGGEVVAGNFQQEVSSTVHIGEQSQQPPNENDQGVTPRLKLGVYRDYWPPTKAPFFCRCCEVLRVILHTNGLFFEKLEIHGRLGTIIHAVHHQNINWDATSTSEYQKIEFVGRTIEEIKQFLVDYCEERNTEGSLMLQDPLSAYYETICSGMDWVEELKDDQIDSDESEDDDMEQEGGNASTSTSKKRDLAVQRERAARMTLNDLSDYFHLPIEQASKHVNLCPTVLKKICRRDGLDRWPYRKVKSLMKQITVLGVQAKANNPATRERTRAEIRKVQKEILDACNGLVPSVLQNIMQQQ